MTERRKLGFEAWINRNHIISRFVLLGAMVQLLWVTLWSMAYAYSSPATGGAASIIAAVQAPVSLFAGWVFKAYLDIMKYEQLDADRQTTTTFKHESTSNTVSSGAAADPNVVTE